MAAKLNTTQAKETCKYILSISQGVLIASFSTIVLTDLSVISKVLLVSTGLLIGVTMYKQAMNVIRELP